MLFDLGWSELLLIGVVALVFIGPKDLPKALRVAGFWVRKARTLSREFQSSIDQMIREAELDEIRQDLKKASELDIEHEFRQTVDPTGSLQESLKPPELPNFAEPEPRVELPASDEAVRVAAEAAEIVPPEPLSPPGPDAADPADPEPAPAPAAPDGAAHDIVPPKP
ncbi:MAG TPA: Sec-independent protein translocase protein TatB [Stellaceae bacterium]|jgi:sec-independent protein translocase protein TatB